jgi:hypothetical protein
MENYLNLHRNSGVASFEIGDNFIIVEFNDHSQYLYNYASCGAGCVEQMKSLAIAGAGLNSYISRTVKKLYASKLR